MPKPLTLGFSHPSRRYKQITLDIEEICRRVIDYYVGGNNHHEFYEYGNAGVYRWYITGDYTLAAALCIGQDIPLNIKCNHHLSPFFTPRWAAIRIGDRWDLPSGEANFYLKDEMGVYERIEPCQWVEENGDFQLGSIKIKVGEPHWPLPVFNSVKRFRFDIALLGDEETNPLTGLCESNDGTTRILAKQVRRDLHSQEFQTVGQLLDPGKTNPLTGLLSSSDGRVATAANQIVVKLKEAVIAHLTQPL